MHSNWLAQHLVRHAEAFNQAYRLARQGDPVHFATAFSDFVRDYLDPLLASLDHWAPEHKAALTETAYHTGLALVRRGWLAHDHQPVVELLFQRLLPDWFAPYPTEAPRLVTQLLNALSHLPDSRRRLELLSRFQDCLPPPEATPDALVILGWMSGLPQFRAAALNAMTRCPELAERLTGVDPSSFRHPWWRGPQRQWHTEAVELGASLWLGGLFSKRPTLRTTPGHTLIQAGNDCWQLHIDAFGQALIPQAADEIPGAPVPDCDPVPPGLDFAWREGDRPRQCLERPYDWVVSFHTRYAVVVIPKTGGCP